MQDKVTIIIPTLNNTQGLLKLIGSLKKSEYKIIIVDNNPTEEKRRFFSCHPESYSCHPEERSDEGSYTKDSSPDKLVQNDNQEPGTKNQQLIYLPQSKNQGFAKGVNIGSENVNSEWILILNDDIELFPCHPKSSTVCHPGTISCHSESSFCHPELDSGSHSKDSSPDKLVQNDKNIIEKLVDYATKNNLVSVSPLLKNKDGKVENYGYKVLPYGKVKLITDSSCNLDPSSCHPELDSGSHSKDSSGSPYAQHQNDMEPATNHQSPITNDQIDGLTAACLLIKTEIFKKIGGFDESFFAYLEDVDLFLRIKKAGLKFGICEEVSVIHHHLTTSKTMGNFKERQDLINWIRLIIKYPKHFQLFNPLNLFKLIVERLRNLFGYLKSFFR